MNVEQGSQPLGIPAIPTIPITVTNSPTQNLAVPVFTIEEATRYVETHPIGRAISHGPFKVVDVRFMTSQQLGALLHGVSVGLPDNALVCYVEVQGSFTFGGRPRGKPLAFQKVYEAFDASNGYLILAGGLP